MWCTGYSSAPTASDGAATTAAAPAAASSTHVDVVSESGSRSALPAVRATANASATTTAPRAMSGSLTAIDRATPPAATARVTRSAGDHPPSPWRMDMTNTDVKPMAEPAASHAPAAVTPGPAVRNCDAAAITARDAKTNHEARCGLVVPRRMSRRYGATQPAVSRADASVSAERASMPPPRLALRPAPITTDA